MIERYTTRINPTVSHADLVKTHGEVKDFNPAEMRKLEFLKVKMEAVFESADSKCLTDLLKELAKK
jgi:hypothetical protein